jgi:hypothetical protein
VDGLARHPGVGFVVVLDDDGPVALGKDGWHRLDDGHVEGDDPLIPFGPYAPAFVKRVAHRPECPDVYVNSLVDPGTEEVAAFEGLVGCHGGLGGWQTEAVLVHPSRWTVERPLFGADDVHQVLVGWLTDLGRRRDVPAIVEGTAANEPDEEQVEERIERAG